MARRTPIPPPEADVPKRRSPLQWLLIGIGLFIILSIALQTCGINIVSRSDEEKLIERPHSDDREERDVPKDLEVEED
ncbi:MAG: hypothetical protein ACK4TA_26050 [Saprospiraceae bacterium]